MAAFMMEFGPHQLRIRFKHGSITDPIQEYRVTADMGIDMANGEVRLRMGHRNERGGLTGGENFFLHHPAMQINLEE